MSGVRAIIAAVGAVLALCCVPAAAEGGGAAEKAMYVAVAPTRVLDTREGNAGPIGPGGTVSVSLSRVVPVTAVAVVINITGAQATESTYITAYPRGTSRRTVSTLNLTRGQMRANLATVQLGTEAGLVFYNSAGSTHLIVDVAGYYLRPVDLSTQAAGSGFVLAAANRLLDTRGTGALGAGGVATIDFSGIVPESATAVAMNVTGVGATQPTFVTVWPADRARPIASNLNLVSSASTPNQVVVALGADRKVSLYNHAGSAHLIADFAGYYVAGGGRAFFSVPPTRLLDTRPARGLGHGMSTTVSLSAILPAEASVIVANFTGTNTTAETYVTAWPYGSNRPATSNLNLVSGQTAANMGITGLGPDKAIQAYNNAGYVDLIIDMAGYFGAVEVE
ncbi:MAG TPA: hypothetical protein VM677_16465 [Actinokineospora sp.]|nr:hypothetical protein [Actinokineospora sp.]